VRYSSLKNMVMSFIQQTSQIIMTEMIFVSINDFQVMLFIEAFFLESVLFQRKHLDKHCSASRLL